jgi:hypothetical protein
MKHVHKFYNHADIPWVHLAWEFYYTSASPPARLRDVSFWWRDCLKTLPTYKNLAICTFVQGNSILLWEDSWSDTPLKLKWPHLFSFAKNGSISIKEALASPHIPDLFHLPISEEALVQLNLFQVMLQDLMPHADNDSWTVLGNSSLHVSKVYNKLMGDVRAVPALDWMWKGCCQQKHKVFFWLLIHNRLNTRALLQRKNFLMTDYSCIMCNQQHLETRDHLFFQCPFAVLCCQYICPLWIPPPPGQMDIQEVLSSLKLAISKPFFMQIIMLVTWSILLTRNSFIFKATTPSVYICRKIFKDELALLVHKAKKKSYHGIVSWVENFR